MRDREKGWQQVTRKTPVSVTNELVDEWTAPVVDSLHLHQLGVVWTNSVQQALAWKSTVRGTRASAADVCKQKLDLGLEESKVSKLAFHLKVSEGKDDQVKHRIVAAVGYLHQLSDVPVTLKRAPRVTKLAQEDSTVVVRLVTSQAFAPDTVWAGLMKGKLALLKDKAIEMLTEHAPSHVLAVFDIFRLQVMGKQCSACLRISKEALNPLLKLSGASWLFVNAPTQLISSYPVVWMSESGPPGELKAMYQRCQDLSAHGLILGHKRLGHLIFSGMPLSESLLRRVLLIGRMILV